MKEKQFLMVDENQSIIVVDAEILRKLDNKRGDMSRSQYLGFLIDGMLKPGKANADGYLPKSEFNEFAQGMKELMRNFLEFFLSYGLELGRQPQDQTFTELSQKLEALSSTKSKSPASSR